MSTEQVVSPRNMKQLHVQVTQLAQDTASQCVSVNSLLEPVLHLTHYTGMLSTEYESTCKQI
jgi:hypothetical protein